MEDECKGSGLKGGREEARDRQKHGHAVGREGEAREHTPQALTSGTLGRMALH